MLSYTRWSFLILTVPQFAWAPISSGQCKDVATAADVVFIATALRTEGVDTHMKMNQVLKGLISARDVIFRHVSPPRGYWLSQLFSYRVTEPHFYILQRGRTYLIYAKRTGHSNVFSQLYGSDYCDDSVRSILP
jgi:hypothetical protein